MRPTSPPLIALATLGLGLLLAAFALRLGLALALPNIARPDEVFQGLEPAHRLLTGWGVVSWEWRDGIRSWLLPGFVAAAMGLGGLTAAAAALSAVSLGVVASGLVLGWRHSRLPGALLCGLLCAVWPDLVYYAPKALTEVQAAHLVVPAAVLAMLASDPACARRWALALAGGAGLLLGLALFMRIQLAPAVLLVAAWAGRLDRGRWGAMLLGGLGPVIAVGGTDALAWGMPFGSVWRNFAANIVEGKAAGYGVSPGGWYLSELVGLWGAAAVPAAAAFALGLRRAPLLAGVAAVVVGSHSLIGHKEISFIHAGVAAAVPVMGLGTAEAVRRLARLLPSGAGRRTALAAMMFWLLTGIAMFASTYPPLLVRNAEAVRAAAWLHGRPDLCGLAYGPGVNWWDSGGYSHLDRAVPIYLLPTQARLDQGAPAANYLLTTAAADPPGYARETCWDTLCVLRRPGGCDPAPALEINATLQRNGQ